MVKFNPMKRRQVMFVKGDRILVNWPKPGPFRAVVIKTEKANDKERIYCYLEGRSEEDWFCADLESVTKEVL